MNLTVFLVGGLYPGIHPANFLSKLVLQLWKTDETSLCISSVNLENQPVQEKETNKDNLSPWCIFDELIGHDSSKHTPVSTDIKEVDMYLSDDILPTKNFERRLELSITVVEKPSPCIT
ncbi:unnamed protein product [Diabrotica balteata]|uniref:Uncharacterized protein n=1 Tax=Diabrotica balteata TaxID=107213 RepID=A0A9N9T8I5_DIABA|nr:unnamed protein product [Diabrotica balteata]